MQPAPRQHLDSGQPFPPRCNSITGLQSSFCTGGNHLAFMLGNQLPADPRTTRHVERSYLASKVEAIKALQRQHGLAAIDE